MPRKKIKHVQIQNEKLRKSTLARRKNSFFKKAYELSVLCGCEIFIIILDMIQGVSTHWPSTDEFNRGFQKFMNIPEHERLRKMVIHQDFLMELVKDAAENLMKLRKKNDEMEMGYLVNQLIYGKSFNEIDATQMDGLNTYIEEKIKELEIRQGKLEKMQGQEQPTNDSVPNEPTMFLTQGGELHNETMFQIQGGEPHDQTMFQMQGMVSDYQTTLQMPGTEMVNAGQGSDIARTSGSIFLQMSGTEMVNAGQGSGVASTSAPTLVDDLRKDQWFFETMCDFGKKFDF